jgi:hypothetical protein
MADIQVASRKTFRNSLALFLEKEMSTPKAVFSYVPADLKSQSPLVCVTGGPTNRKRETPQSYDNAFGLTIRNITIYSLESNTQWTPEMAEDMIDKLEWEASIALLHADQQARSMGFRSIMRNGTSVPDVVKILGVSYLIENIPVLVEVDDVPQE